MRQPSRRAFLAGAFATTAGLAGCSIPGEQVTDRTSRTVEATAATPLIVANTTGAISVTDGATDGIEMTVTKRTRYGEDLFEEVTVESDTTDDRTRIETAGDDIPDDASVAVDLDLTLPDDVPVERLRTRNGDVSATDVAGDATLTTTNGRVRADAVDGFLTLRSTNGAVEARDVGGIDAVETTNGEVDVEVPAIRGDVTVETTNGPIRVAVPDDFDAVVDLETTNGDAGYSGLDLTVDIDRTARLRGTLGEGGDTLTAETTNGDVRLRPI